MNLGGVSFGPQVGVQITELVLVFKKKKSLDRVLEGKGKLTLGADAAVAAGPLGRRAEASTDGQFKAEVLSYSRSRGVFAGVSLDGGVLAPADGANREFATPTAGQRQAADELKGRLLGVLLERDPLPPPPVRAAPPDPLKLPPAPLPPPPVIPDTPRK